MAIGIEGGNKELWEKLAAVDVVGQKYAESGSQAQKDSELRKFLTDNLAGKNVADLISLQNELLQAVEKKRDTIPVGERNEFDAEAAKAFRHLNKLMGQAPPAPNTPKKETSDPSAITAAREIEATTQAWNKKAEALADDKITPPAPESPVAQSSTGSQKKQTLGGRFLSAIQGVINTVANSAIANRIREAITGKVVVGKVGPASPEQQKENEQKIIGIAADTKQQNSPATNVDAQPNVEAQLKAAATLGVFEKSADGAAAEISHDAKPVSESDELSALLDEFPSTGKPLSSEEQQVLDELFNDTPSHSAEEPEPTDAEINELTGDLERDIGERKGKEETLDDAILQEKGDPNKPLEEAAEAIKSLDKPNDAKAESSADKMLKDLDAALAMIDEPAKKGANDVQKKTEAPTPPSPSMGKS
jgi:hypothetical protein